MQNINEFQSNTVQTDVTKGKLLIVSTPIGNKSDYTIRAVNALKIVDYVICEEIKEGVRILKDINLSKELIALNEQNEESQANEVIELIKRGKKVALVSDCGTPVFADPGAYLVRKIIQLDLPIEVIPGVTSIMTALVRSGLDINTFYYAGFLSRKPEERIVELKTLAKLTSTLVILETPYRLLTLLKAASEVMPHRQAYLAFNLTTIFESHHYGTLKQLYEKFLENKTKAEFVLCIEGSGANSFPIEHSTEVKPKVIKKKIKIPGREAPSHRSRDNYSDRGNKRDFQGKDNFQNRDRKPRGKDTKKSW